MAKRPCHQWEPPCNSTKSHLRYYLDSVFHYFYHLYLLTLLPSVRRIPRNVPHQAKACGGQVKAWPNHPGKPTSLISIPRVSLERYWAKTKPGYSDAAWQYSVYLSYRKFYWFSPWGLIRMSCHHYRGLLYLKWILTSHYRRSTILVWRRWVCRCDYR